MATRGGLLKLLDAYVAIGGDTSGFDAAVDKAEGRAKAAGSRLEGAFSPRRVLGALGAAAGAAFGVALSGANQLDAATRQLQADTGMTAEEAKSAEHALAGMYRNNLQGFDAIGAAMAKVHNDLGLVGDEADRTTAKFLRYTRVTKQDAAAAVTDFDDILDAWGLTAADAGGIMDKLIASHQKYGGVITEDQKALAQMAPAMRAANMSIDDGIGLLNLFAASGIDAAAAPAMLARAVRQLKPGQDIDDLIAQLSAIEDPTLRGQRALELFGRQGLLMANAIKPGIEGLDDFTTSTEENTDAMERGAEAALSWSDRFDLFVKNIAGSLAELGTQFGPLLMVAAAFGPKLTTALMSGLGGIGGLLIPKITGALTGAIGIQSWMTTGTMIGTTIGAAIGPAMALAAGAAVVMVWSAINDELNKQAAKIASDTAAFVEVATFEQLRGSRAAIQKGLQDIYALPYAGLLYGDQIASLRRDLDAVDAEIEARRTSASTARLNAAAEAAGATEKAAKEDGARSAAAWIDGLISDFMARMPVAADQVVDTFGTSLSGVRAAAKRTGADGMAAMAEGIAEARAKPLDAFEQLREMLKHQMSRTAETGRLMGQLTSKELAEGLRSRDPEVRAQAIATKQTILDRLAELAARGKDGSHVIGTKAMEELNRGLRSKDPEIRAAAAAAKKIVVDKLNETKAAANTIGAQTAAAFISGMAARLSAQLGNRPVMNENRSQRQFEASHAAGAWEIPHDQVALIHEGEMVIPAAPAEAIRSGRPGPGGAAGGGGNTYNIPVTVNNPEPRAAEPDIGRVLRRITAMGLA